MFLPTLLCEGVGSRCLDYHKSALDPMSKQRPQDRAQAFRPCMVLLVPTTSR
jgi:hypothetical protein